MVGMILFNHANKGGACEPKRQHLAQMHARQELAQAHVPKLGRPATFLSLVMSILTPASGALARNVRDRGT
jgi:hypothetical protein